MRWFVACAADAVHEVICHGMKSVAHKLTVDNNAPNGAGLTALLVEQRFQPRAERKMK
jgi:hypothetical protein